MLVVVDQPLNVFEASRLQAMYQELLPLGYNPLSIYNKMSGLLDALCNDPDTASLDFIFDMHIGLPCLPKDGHKGSLFVSIHFSEYFHNIALTLARVYPQKSVYELMSRASLNSLPEWKQEAYRAAEASNTIRLIFSEDPFCARKILRALKQGDIVLGFADAMTGSGAEVKSFETHFLTNKIQAPLGLFLLAQKAGVPITPVVAHNSDLGAVLAFGNSYPMVELEQEASEIYNYFSKVIATAPEKWTQWGFMYDQSCQEYPLEFTDFTSQETVEFDYEQRRLQFDFNKGYLDELAS